MLPRPIRADDPYEAERRERDRRVGLDHNPREHLDQELALAERLAEHGSLPPGDAGARRLARRLLGRSPGLGEHPQDDERLVARFVAGEAVSHRAGEQSVRGHVVRDLADGLVEVDFGRHGRSVVEADQLDTEAA